MYPYPVAGLFGLIPIVTKKSREAHRTARIIQPWNFFISFLNQAGAQADSRSGIFALRLQDNIIIRYMEFFYLFLKLKEISLIGDKKYLFWMDQALKPPDCILKQAFFAY